MLILEEADPRAVTLVTAIRGGDIMAAGHRCRIHSKVRLTHLAGRPAK